MTRYTGTNPRLQQLAEELRAQFRKAELERRRMAGITPVAGPFLLPPPPSPRCAAASPASSRNSCGIASMRPRRASW